ncbi:MAG: prephenate dehydrogenase, partial [Synergistales bacterium]|nr:prephenate dehydrogenase [Synergistales bacterium]
MNKYVDVVVPGPWWNPLTYRSDRMIPEGSRVLVPVGRSKRTGFVSANSGSDQFPNAPSDNIRDVISLIDPVPVIPEDLWELSEWAGRNFLCGRGEALKVILPSPLTEGEGLPLLENRSVKAPPGYSISTSYIPEDNERYEGYISELEKIESGGLVVFPEFSQARSFYRSLPNDIRDKWILWPKTGKKRTWQTWLDVRGGKYSGVIGSSAASFAPLPFLELLIIEDESNWAYRQVQYPYFNIRSLLVQRSKILHGRLLLGGRLPSSRVFSTLRPSFKKVSLKNRVFFVDMKDIPKPKISGVDIPFSVSQRMLAETDKTLKEGKIALWILDRKGYAGEIFCLECGFHISCPKCGSAMTWHSRKQNLICHLCGAQMPLPDGCPNCRGSLLKGRRPGLDALQGLASSLVSTDLPVMVWHADHPKGERARKELVKTLADGGLVTGSRSALSLCDELPTGTVCWIDADLEAVSASFESNFKAYSMIWESCFRGKDS